jgi:AraC-like DNA-binding protein
MIPDGSPIDLTIHDLLDKEHSAMILRRQLPSPRLAGFVEFFWYYEGWNGSHPMERVLPDGTFELVINLLDGPRKLFDRGDLARYSSFRRGWLSGTHSRYIVIDTLPGASMIGAHFKPGGARRFLGPASDEFHDQVVEFEAVWGTRARDLRERLLAAPGPTAKFHHLEHFLAGLLSWSRKDAERHQAVAWATNQIYRQPQMLTIGAVIEKLGISHKHFIEQFREQVGLTPKLFCRIRRFQEALVQINSRRQIDWAELACDCGYYDQSHFINDFQAFTGLNPTSYRCLDEDYANFVPVSEKG